MRKLKRYLLTFVTELQRASPSMVACLKLRSFVLGGLVRFFSFLCLLATAAWFEIILCPLTYAQAVQLQCRPSLATVVPGQSMLITPIVQRSEGYSGKTSLSVSGLPKGASASFEPSNVSGAWAVTLLNVNTAKETPIGVYQLTILGKTGNVTATTNFTLTVSSGTTFKHPGVLIGSAQLAKIQAMVNEKKFPWYQAFQKMTKSRYGSLSYKPTAHDKVDAGSKSADDLIEDSEAAYTQALLWTITHNPTYAKNAINIMDAWAATLSSSFIGMNRYNDAAWTGDVWPRAAEIIRSTYVDSNGSTLWPPSDIERFKSFLKTYYLPLLVNDRGHGYFGGNLHASTAAAMINIGVFMDDPSIFYRGLWMWRYEFPSYIYEPEDGSYPLPPLGWSAAQTTPAAMVKYWFDQTSFLKGLGEESCRDLGHMRWGLAAIANGAETAYLQGIDLYQENSLGTPNYIRMKNGLEFNATILNGGKIPANLCNGSINLGGSVGTGEIAYHALTKRYDQKLPQTEIFLKSVRPTAADYFISWETLTHFDSPQ